MATLTKTLQFLAQRGRPFLYQQQRYAGYWNKDWKPGPIPRTPEERAAAAKKYGLRPEDYNCLEENEIGDYPHLPFVSKTWRDPYEDYDLPGEKRNYGEALHPFSEHVGFDQQDTASSPDPLTLGQSFLRFILIFFVSSGTFIFFDRYRFSLPEMPKQYPFNNLYLEKGGDPDLQKEVKHYTFEPASAE